MAAGRENVSAFPVEPGIYVHERFPAYAPDGALAWVRGDSGGYCDCLVLREDGAEPVELRDLDGAPVWSPDGSLIMTTSRAGTGISIVDRHGVVIATVEDGGDPSWQRMVE